MSSFHLGLSLCCVEGMLLGPLLSFNEPSLCGRLFVAGPSPPLGLSFRTLPMERTFPSVGDGVTAGSGQGFAELRMGPSHVATSGDPCLCALCPHPSLKSERLSLDFERCFHTLSRNPPLPPTPRRLPFPLDVPFPFDRAFHPGSSPFRSLSNTVPLAFMAWFPSHNSESKAKHARSCCASAKRNEKLKRRTEDFSVHKRSTTNPTGAGKEQRRVEKRTKKDEKINGNVHQRSKIGSTWSGTCRTCAGDCVVSSWKGDSLPEK